MFEEKKENAKKKTVAVAEKEERDKIREASSSGDSDGGCGGGNTISKRYYCTMCVCVYKWPTLSSIKYISSIYICLCIIIFNAIWIGGSPHVVLHFV